MELINELEAILGELLDDKYYKSTKHLVEELKAEQPISYRKIGEVFGTHYGLSGCGTKMSPVTAVGIALNKMVDSDKAMMKMENGSYFWCLKNS